VFSRGDVECLDDGGNRRRSGAEWNEVILYVPTADRGHNAAGFEQWGSEGRIVAIFNRRLLNGRVTLRGRAEGLQFGEENFAVAIGVAEGVQVVQIVPTLHQVEARHSFQKRADRDSQKTVLFCITQSRRPLRALTAGKK